MEALWCSERGRVARCGVALALAACAAAPPVEQHETVFYRPRDVGSDATYDPFSTSLSYVLDSAQVGDFETTDFWPDVGDVLDHLVRPGDTIGREGGYRDFVNTEVFPIDPTRLGDSKAILPNVALHAMGGGLVYRKNAEWFQAHGVPAPYVVSGTLAMVSEVLGEATEKPVADDTDELADVFLFRPLGLWLYSDDERARRLRDTLDPVAWPNLLLWDVDDERFVNLGLSYAVRPRWLGSESVRPFGYFGITNLFGLSHAIGDGDALSWGLGAATETVRPTRIRASAGVFYDRRGSLLASLVGNGAEGYAARLNLYPGVLFGTRGRVGLFVGVPDEGGVDVGVQVRFPVGLAR